MPLDCPSPSVLPQRVPAGSVRSRQAGVVTPFGVIVLSLGLIVALAAVALLVRYVGSAHIAAAQRTAVVVANRAALVGLDHLVNGTHNNTPIPVIALPEPVRTQAVVDRIHTTALPTGAASRYMAPLGPDDILVELSMLSARVEVTVRTGRSGQFVHTASRSAAVLAANSIQSGRILDVPGVGAMAAGALPLAVSLEAIQARNAGQTDGLQGAPTVSRVPIRLGSHVFAAAPTGVRQQQPSRLLADAAAFLGYDGYGTPLGAAPPALTVGQELSFGEIEMRTAGLSEPSSSLADVQATEVQNALVEHLLGRAVIVPVVEGTIVRAFAVATIDAAADSNDGLVLSLLPSSLSPIARHDPDAGEVSADLQDLLGSSVGLAMGLGPMLEHETDDLTDQDWTGFPETA